MRYRIGFGTLVVTIAALGGSASPAAERMVGVVPSDGLTALVKRFDVPAGATILGVRFESNDPTTVFPKVSLVQGALDAVSKGVVVAAVANVRETSAGIVTVLWPEPIVASGKDPYYVAICMPGPRKMGPGLGTALGANDVEEPNGSFLTYGEEQSLLPIRVDLALALIIGSAKTTSQEEQPPPEVGSHLSASRTFLDATRPNPANPATAIEFGLAQAVDATITIYDISGRQVRSLVHEALPAGVHMRVWDGFDDRGRAAATGVYVVTLRAGVKVLTQKLVIAK